MPSARQRRMKNLLVLHLESITRQRLDAFASSFPNTRRLMQQGRVYDRFFSSATSTLMVVACPSSTATTSSSTPPPSSRACAPGDQRPPPLSLLQERGWSAELVCLNGFHTNRSTTFSAWAGDLPPVWGTNNFPTLFALRPVDRHDAVRDLRLGSHHPHRAQPRPGAYSGYTDQVRRACKVADDAVGVFLATLERKGLLDKTTVVVYGDHGDDYWTHGFKGGMVHATDPVRHHLGAAGNPRSCASGPGSTNGWRARFDIAPTCLELPGRRPQARVRTVGAGAASKCNETISRKTTASQPDSREWGPSPGEGPCGHQRQLRAACELARARALRLPPRPRKSLQPAALLRRRGGRALRCALDPAAPGHFRAALLENPRAAAHIAARLRRCERATRIAAKRAFAAARGVDPAARWIRGASRPSPRPRAPRRCRRRPESPSSRRSSSPTGCAEQARGLRPGLPRMRYLILAAGMGKRMRPRGPLPRSPAGTRREIGPPAQLPKCLIEIHGEPLIRRLLRQIRRHDAAADVRVVLGYRAELVAAGRRLRDRARSFLRRHRHQRIAVVRARGVRGAADGDPRRRRTLRRTGGRAARRPVAKVSLVAFDSSVQDPRRDQRCRGRRSHHALRREFHRLQRGLQAY